MRRKVNRLFVFAGIVAVCAAGTYWNRAAARDRSAPFFIFTFAFCLLRGPVGVPSESVSIDHAHDNLRRLSVLRPGRMQNAKCKTEKWNATLAQNGVTTIHAARGHDSRFPTARRRADSACWST